MNSDQRKLIRQQLEKTLQRYSELKTVNPPGKGWIRAIRDALGMSTRQLGDRIGVTKTRITRIEQDEVSGSVTLKTMRRMADALDCVFVYGFVPRKSLEETIRQQAVSILRKRMARVAHSMALEDQGLSGEEQKKALESAVEELVRSHPKTFWEVER